MKTLIILAVLFVSHITRAERTETQLYDSVVANNFDEAVSIAKELKEKNPIVLQQALNHYLWDQIQGSVEFSYRLWNSDAKDIVTDYFPPQYQLLLNNGEIKIGQDLQMAAPGKNSDGQPETIQSTDNESQNNWKFIPKWDTNRLYFKIQNVDTNEFLKFDETMDNGKHVLKESEDDNTYEWYLVPKKDYPTSQSSFSILNRKYNEPIHLEAVPARRVSKDRKNTRRSHFDN